MKEEYTLVIDKRRLKTAALIICALGFAWGLVSYGLFVRELMVPKDWNE